MIMAKRCTKCHQRLPEVQVLMYEYAPGETEDDHWLIVTALLPDGTTKDYGKIWVNPDDHEEARQRYPLHGQ